MSRQGDLADEHGIDALTMRSLWDALGVLIEAGVGGVQDAAHAFRLLDGLAARRT